MGKSSTSPSDLAIDDAFDAASPGIPPPQYLDLEVLRNADSLVAIISQRRSNGVITFAIFKEFDRDGRRDRTSFVAESLGPSYRDLLDIALKRIEAIKASPALLKKLQGEALKAPRSPLR